jgi:hypothetical protein
MRCGARPGKVGGIGTVHTYLLLAACIHGSASPAQFPAACRGSTLGAWAGCRRGCPDGHRVLPSER